MTIHLSRSQARRFLATYHFTQTDLPGVFERLGTVQYDPLNPAGRNPDLVLQARIPGYQVDDWQQAAYTDRLIYDSWDKQACLVPVSDWSFRACTRDMYRPYHDREILQTGSETAARIMSMIDTLGPLSSLEFEDRVRISSEDSWSGNTRTQRSLRAMWVCGQLVTHHRKGGRHYYDRPERVIPAQHYNVPPLTDKDAYHRWIVKRRYQAVGLLRPIAEACVWSACGDGTTRKRAIAQLAEEGELTPVKVGEKAWPYYMPTDALHWLDAPEPEPRMIFLGPLDSIIWDRKAVLQIFDFDYIWEVYKPAEQRRWGYYVLPVFYGDRFVARVDSQLEKGTWNITCWWWEPDITPDAELFTALEVAVVQFLHYLRAQNVRVSDAVDAPTRTAILAAIS